MTRAYPAANRKHQNVLKPNQIAIVRKTINFEPNLTMKPLISNYIKQVVVCEDMVEYDRNRVGYGNNSLTDFGSLSVIYADLMQEQRNKLYDILDNNWDPLNGEWIDLVFGDTEVTSKCVLQWLRHPILFNPAIPWQLIQLSGGQCGAIACLQAMVFLHLIYRNEGIGSFQSRLVDTKPAELRLATAAGLAHMIWNCSTTDIATLCFIFSTDCEQFGGSYEEINNNDTVKTLPLQAIMNSLITCARSFRRFEDLQQYIYDNLLTLFCAPRTAGYLNLVLSCAVTRGLDKIYNEDSDTTLEKTGLIDANGQCSQRLLSLLLLGRAVANVFDDNIYLGDLTDTLVLKGIPHRSLVGYLTQMEVLRYCTVGDYLKNPFFPVWVVGRANHFTVLMALDPSAAKFSREELLRLEIDEAFKRLDPDDHGFITVDKLDALMACFEMTVPKSDALCHIKHEDGVIFKSNYFVFMKDFGINHSRLRSFFNDPVNTFRIRQTTDENQYFLYTDSRCSNKRSLLLNSSEMVTTFAASLMCPTNVDNGIAAEWILELLRTRGRSTPAAMYQVPLYAGIAS